MRKKVWYGLLILFFNIQICFAQNFELTGIVVEQTNQMPLTGVSVIIKGEVPVVETISDKNGKFLIPVHKNDTLIFSFPGMKQLEMIVERTDHVVVELCIESEMLDEVQVVAYGVQRKKEITGAVSVVHGNERFRDLAISTFEQVLQGAVPGITVNVNSGQPGAEMDVRVRGTASMDASKTPLYVIDGIPVLSGNIATSNIKDDSKALNAMATLNPGDIETISILKDAAASSMYGSRAANGVILITTKKGKSGKTRLSFKGSLGISDWAVESRKILNGDKQRILTYEAFYNEAVLYGGKTEEEARNYAQENADKYTPELNEYSNWEKALFNKYGVFQKYEVTLQGGNEITTYYASLGYKKEEGKAKISEMEGITGNLSITHRSSDRLRFGANVSLAKQKSYVSNEGPGYGNSYYALKRIGRPNYKIYNEDKSYYEGYPFDDVNTPNLLKIKDKEKNISDVFRSANSGWASYQILKGFEFKQTLSYEFVFNESGVYYPASSYNGMNHNGYGVKIPYQYHNLYSSSILTYSNVYSSMHSLDVLAGWDMEKRTRKYVLAAGKNYPNEKLPELVNSSQAASASSNIFDDRLLSFLSRVNYGFKDKYYLSANFRTDGSSRLGADEKWGVFWSLSAAWRLDRENFMTYVGWIDNLKVRMSYGVNGTLPEDLYGHLGLFKSGADYQENPGYAYESIANPDLKWEKNYVFDIGFDIRLFDCLNIVFDYYDKSTKDLLQNVPVSLVTGFDRSLQNIGSINNRGVELDINIDIFRNSNISWNTGFVLSHNKNKITKLYNGLDIIDGMKILREGEAFYSFWLREWAGVDPETGEEMWVMNTENADGSVNKEVTKDATEVERTITGSAEPKITGGWRNILSWKGLTFNALFSYSFGGKLFDNTALTSTDRDGGLAFTNIGVQQWKRWQKPGDKTNVPRRINGYKYSNYASDRHMKSSDYIRLKSVVLSYSLPPEWVKKARLENVKLFVSGMNLWTWSKYKNVDPEQPIDGFTTWAWPVLKTYSFGIEIGF